MDISQVNVQKLWVREKVKSKLQLRIVSSESQVVQEMRIEESRPIKPVEEPKLEAWMVATPRKPINPAILINLSLVPLEKRDQMVQAHQKIQIIN